MFLILKQRMRLDDNDSWFVKKKKKHKGGRLIYNFSLIIYLFIYFICLFFLPSLNPLLQFQNKHCFSTFIAGLSSID